MRWRALSQPAWAKTRLCRWSIVCSLYYVGIWSFQPVLLAAGFCRSWYGKLKPFFDGTIYILTKGLWRRTKLHLVKSMETNLGKFGECLLSSFFYWNVPLILCGFACVRACVRACLLVRWRKMEKEDCFACWNRSRTAVLKVVLVVVMVMVTVVGSKSIT